jgi:hypothetical protein
MNIVDSSGWVEYFQDTARADLFAWAIESRHQLLVPTIALFEVHKVLSRSLPLVMVDTCLNVMRLGRVPDLTDAAMYSMGFEFGATFWTQDVDYDGLPSVRYFPKPKV